LFFPNIDTLLISIAAYFVFTGLNIAGLKVAATFELLITLIAVMGLVLFASVSLPEVQWENLQQNALPNGFLGVFAAIPFAIWFFLAIEDVANVAKETINPQRNILIGFGTALLTLVILRLITIPSPVGVGAWESIVPPRGSETAPDSPL